MYSDRDFALFGDFIKGTCKQMCPEKERKMREKERLLHPLERLATQVLNKNEFVSSNQRTSQSKQNEFYVADPSKTIKAFSRSAAGHKMPVSAELRPFPVLDMTVTYLIENIACTDIETQGWLDRYNFVTDRLRAVRQDMIIQNLPPSDCVKLLEPMVKFHVFSSYWLCEKPISSFDPKMNYSFLQECVKHLLVMYASMRKSKHTPSEVASNFDQQCEEILSHCNSSEHLMNALYLLINLGNAQALNHGISRIVNTNIHCKSCVELKAYKISLASLLGNYARVCHLTKQLSPLLCMAVAPHLSSIRRHALLVMSSAYTSKSLKFPISTLQDMLLWDKKQALLECKYYGLEVEDFEGSNPQIRFQKGVFNQYANVAQPSRLTWLDETLKSLTVTKILSKH